MPLALHHDDPATLLRRRRLTRLWAGMVVGWSLLRTLLVWAAVGDYGLNPWIYLGIDLVSATVDAITTPRMVLSFIDDKHRHAARWALLSLVAFVIPDLYIFLGTRTLPRNVVIIVLSIIALTFAIAVTTVVRKVRAGRSARKALRA